jgi:RNA polymerase subunit RPABC4/transcription elongation factor Spt4
MFITEARSTRRCTEEWVKRAIRLSAENSRIARRGPENL